MTPAGRKPHEAVWLEPVAALILFAFALFINSRAPWPYIWVIDLVACTGAAISRRWPVAGAILTALGLAIWLPTPGAVASASGMSFYINVFAAARMNLSWKVPLTLGLGGLAYLTLVRNAVEDPAYRWTAAIILLIVLAIAWGGGTAMRFAAHRLQSEQETSQQRLQNLQISLARELHDSVAQTLSSAAMRANIALTDPGMAPLTREQLERIAEDCRSSAHDLRQLLSSLREAPERTVNPAPLADVESLRHAVQVQADRLHGEGFTVNTDIRITRLSAARCQTLAAITVEATNNVLKHAKPGSTCSLSMVASEDDVVAEFTNVAKNAKKSKQGFGLTGIQERLTLLDGTCSVFRRDDQWTLQARLPLGVGGNAGTTHATSALRMAR